MMNTKEPLNQLSAVEWRIFCRRLLPVYCESSAFTVKIKLSASASPLAGQPPLMHKNTHASSAFIYGGAGRGMNI